MKMNQRNESNQIIVQYFNRINSRFRNFKWKTYGKLANFSCPLCGDSSKKTTKARGYLLLNSHNTLYFFCHNCEERLSFSKFLKKIDPHVYDEYIREIYGAKKVKEYVWEEPVFEKIVSKKIDIPSINELDIKHEAYKYITGRKLPESTFHRIFYAEDFKEWVNSIVPNKYPNLQTGDSRIILPFFNSDGSMMMAQGRSITNSGMRYITVRFNEETPKVFGLEQWKEEEKTYVVEGPFDSLFFDNALACAGSDLFSFDFLNKENTTLIYDNEPRNPQIISKMAKAIKKGYQIFFWPEKINMNDINELMMIRKKPKDLEELINKNTKKGLSATLHLNNWKRC